MFVSPAFSVRGALRRGWEWEWEREGGGGGLRDERKEQEDEEVVGEKVGVDGVQ